MPPERPDEPGAPPPLHVEGSGGAWAFDRPFTIGRDAACDVVVDSARATRRHVELTPDADGWRLRDLGSSNGTLLDGVRVERARVPDAADLQIGRGGPHLRLRIGPTAPVHSSTPLASSTPTTPPFDPFRPPADELAPHPQTEEARFSDRAPSSEGVRSAWPAPPSGDGDGDDLSYDAVVERYFGAGVDESEMGDRTRFIRQAYGDIQKAQTAATEKQHSRYRGLVVVALVVSVVAVAYAGYQEVRIRSLRAEAAAIFYELKSRDVALAQRAALVEQQIEADPDASDSLRVDFERALATRRATAARYDRFVRGIGVYDGLSSEEELIYKTARAFGESELTIPPAFVDEVKQQIDYWKRGRRFVDGVRRAQVEGHDVDAVRALRRHGMPTEFFYLALQESDFKTRAVGPPTRYGYAKGAWQFIPETGTRYGLTPGPLVDTDRYDPLDERHDFPQAADAAARYLRDIYVHLAQASGLLVCASYNWGEGRVRKNMRQIQRDLSDIENSPEARTYWKFLTTYRDRMPSETKDYVMKIFAAAVIGQNPRRFGIDMDPPVEVALRGGRGGIRTRDAPTGERTTRLGGDALDARQLGAESDSPRR